METNPDMTIDVDEALVSTDTAQLDHQHAMDATSERPVSDNPSESAQETSDRNLNGKEQVLLEFFCPLCCELSGRVRDQRERGSGWMEKYRDEDSDNPRWRRHKKHFFIVSSAGKPIFSRYGDEEKLNPIFGVMGMLCRVLESLTVYNPVPLSLKVRSSHSCPNKTMCPAPFLPVSQ